MRLPWACAILGCALIAGCSEAPGNRGTARDSKPSASASTTDIDGNYDVGGGREMFITCRGTGKPTILLEAGGGDDSESWPRPMFFELVATTRTCAYDRAGTGNSDPAPNRPRLMKDVVADLVALLAAADVEGPYLLVGTSLGGQVALVYALLHTDQTAGLVILDTDWPTTNPARTADSLLTPAERAQFEAMDAWNSPQNTEHIDHKSSAGETELAVHPLPGMPIRILTATVPEECDGAAARCATIHQRRVALQAQWLSLSPKTATRRLVPATHNLPEVATDEVRDEILATLADARGK